MLWWAVPSMIEVCLPAILWIRMQRVTRTTASTSRSMPFALAIFLSRATSYEFLATPPQKALSLLVHRCCVGLRLPLPARQVKGSPLTWRGQAGAGLAPLCMPLTKALQTRALCKAGPGPMFRGLGTLIMVACVPRSGRPSSGQQVYLGSGQETSGMENCTACPPQ